MCNNLSQWEVEGNSELTEYENKVLLDDAQDSQDDLSSVAETVKEVALVQPVEAVEAPVGRQSQPPRWHDD